MKYKPWISEKKNSFGVCKLTHDAPKNHFFRDHKVDDQVERLHIFDQHLIKDTSLFNRTRKAIQQPVLFQQKGVRHIIE